MGDFSLWIQCGGYAGQRGGQRKSRKGAGDDANDPMRHALEPR